jgi:hypothetical protein
MARQAHKPADSGAVVGNGASCCRLSEVVAEKSKRAVEKLMVNSEMLERRHGIARWKVTHIGLY